MGGLGGIVSVLAKMPALTGTAIAGIIVGRYMKGLTMYNVYGSIGLGLENTSE